MRLHILAQPNCPTTKAYALDGFAQATIRFCRMMKNLGHTVFLYGCETTEAPCDRFIQCITLEETTTLLEFYNCQYQHASVDYRSPIWQLANPRMIRGIAEHKQPGDIICLIGGSSQEPVTRSHPELRAVEYTIGYLGSFAPYRVFESVAWRHTTYGSQKIENGRPFDAVIPLFFDPEEFTFRADKEPFALYLGRMIDSKGIGIACRVAHATGMPLYVIGHGGDSTTITHGATYLGALDMDARNDYLSRASVLLSPTQHIEPFGSAAIEAQLSGTPVISTDWGGYTDTVEHGKTGFRCNTFEEFVAAMGRIATLDPHYIRNRAVELYGMEAIALKYEQYFERLMTDRGWETMHAAQSGVAVPA